MSEIKEIEVKAKVANQDALMRELERIGCTLSEPLSQSDVIFIFEGNEFPKVKPGSVVLRLREQGEKILFTLKQPQANELDAIEKEVEVSDRQQMEDILKILGFKEVVRVNKKRRKARYQDCEICLDEVETLGVFIEVEKKSSEDGPTIQKELQQFLTSLGVQIADIVSSGYDTLVYQSKST